MKTEQPHLKVITSSELGVVKLVRHYYFKNMPKKLTHEEFLKKLWNKNEHYRNGEFEIVGEYKSALSLIDVKTKYGICRVETNSLIKGWNTNITSSLNKSDYCINMFREFHGDLYAYPNLIYEGNTKKIKAICKKHGQFFVTPKEHFKGSKCNKCAKEVNNFKLQDWKTINPTNNGLLYLIECFNEKERFLKIGITSSTLDERYKTPSKMPYNYEIIFVLEYINRDIIWELEKEVKKFILPYQPLISFKGSKSECFEDKYKGGVLHILNSYQNYLIENLKNYESNN